MNSSILSKMLQSKPFDVFINLSTFLHVRFCCFLPYSIQINTDVLHQTAQLSTDACSEQPWNSLEKVPRKVSISRTVYRIMFLFPCLCNHHTNYANTQLSAILIHNRLEATLAITKARSQKFAVHCFRVAWLVWCHIWRSTTLQIGIL